MFNSKIKVFGIGGLGINVLNSLIEKTLEGVNYACFDTEETVWTKYKGKNRTVLPIKLKFSIGAGIKAGPTKELLPESAIKHFNHILQDETKIVFITSGMGRFTGTGLTPILTKLCKDKGILVFCVVTMPSDDEGELIKLNAEAGISELNQTSDKLLIISNNKLAEGFNDIKSLQATVQISNLLHNILTFTYDILYTNEVRVSMSEFESYFNKSNQYKFDILYQLGLKIQDTNLLHI